MAKKRKKELSMRKIREILRLDMICKMGKREISRSLSISHPSVLKYTQRVEDMGLTYEQITKMDDDELRNRFKVARTSRLYKERPEPDWEWIHKELKKKSVTLQLLWEEYKAIHPDGYQSTQFNHLYNQWKKKLNVSMRQIHKTGEKMFVDYAGQTVPVIDRITGEIREAQVYVAVLGASNYTYAEATLDQSLPNWIDSHIHAFEYFEGVPGIVVPDNLKSGVDKTCKYEPDINSTYQDMAVHYGTVIIPTRVRKPKDKAKVEAGVQVVERWILAALRNRTFFSIEELNEAIEELLVKLNTRPFKKLQGTRESVFNEIEKDSLLPLPENRYQYAEWKKAKVNIDYHIELNHHYYSVPYVLVHEEVEIRYTSRTVEIFYKGKRKASHIRNNRPGRHSTQKEHMPKSHRQYLEWSPSRIINWASNIGESCAHVVEKIINTRKHPEQAYRSCLGILRLGKRYSNQRLEAACKRASDIGGLSYKSVRSILEKGLDKDPANNNILQLNITHDNIRGSQYYNN